MVSMTAARPAGRVGAAQLVVVEVVAIAAAAAVFALPPAAAGVVGAVVAAGLLGAAVRFRGRWGYEVVGARWRLARRRRAARQEAGAGAAIGLLAPELTLATARDRGGAVGIGEDGAGWFAAVAVLPHDGLARGAATELRLDRLARLAADPAFPAGVLQVVTRRAPAPAAGDDPRASYARSYSELRRALGVPGPLDIWLAVRLGPRDGAAAAADRGGGRAGVHRALAAAVSRVGSELAAMGIAYRVLDADSLRLALTVACGPLSPGPARESWSRWQAGTEAHVCFAVRGWPERGAGDPFARLTDVPSATSVHAALLLTPSRADDQSGGDGGGVAAQTVVRVAAATGDVSACVKHLHATAATLGVRLVRLNGEQAAGVYATTPTGAATGLVPW